MKLTESYAITDHVLIQVEERTIFRPHLRAWRLIGTIIRTPSFGETLDMADIGWVDFVSTPQLLNYFTQEKFDEFKEKCNKYVEDGGELVPQNVLPKCVEITV